MLSKLGDEVSMLCSRKKPSLLRKTNKEDLVNFKLESLGEEWKTRVLLFHSFLMAASVKKEKVKSSSWIPSMSLAGLILLKQRNGAMNATASVKAILMKAGAKEVCLLFIQIVCLHLAITLPNGLILIIGVKDMAKRRYTLSFVFFAKFKTL